jgi:hypothetical protein
MRRAEWDYFCLEEKTPSFGKDVAIELTPEFFPPHEMKGYGNLDFFSLVGNMRYQCVSPELKRVKVTVTATFYKKRKTITVGTAELTRE